jgi:MFS family permease
VSAGSQARVPGTFARARSALRSPDFSLLLACRLASQLADGFFQAYLVAEIVFLNPEGHSTAAGVAKAYALLVIPFSVLGPLSGVLIDRWSRRRILLATPVLKAAAVVALIPLGGTSIWLYVPALVVVSLNRFFLTTATSSIPSLVADQDLLMANSMSTVGGTVVTFVGIVVGTKLVKPLGAASVLWAGAALYLLAGFLATRIRQPLRAVRPDASVRAELSRVFADLWSGAKRLAATPVAAGSITCISADQFLVGFVTVLSLVVFKQRFHQGVGSYGNIIAAGGAGVLAGTLTVGLFEERMEKPRIVAVAFALAAVVCLAVAPDIGGVTILLTSFVLGLTFAWRKIPVDTMVQEAVPDRFRGRVFAVYDITYSMSRVAAAGLAVLLIPHVTAGWLLFLVGVVYALLTPALPVWVRRPQWAELRFYAGGRADEVPRTVVFGGEEAPVEVLMSWIDERDGERLRRFRLQTEEEGVIRLSAPETGGRWRIEREAGPAEQR